MKSPITILSLSVAITTMFSCNHVKPENKQTDSSEVLEDKGSLLEYASIRKGRDLVDQLYTDLLTKDTELRDLENKIQLLQQNKADSTASFNGYNSKNKDYYSDAKSHAELVKDSLLRKRISALITKSISKYDSLTDAHNSLLLHIEKKEITLSDLHELLMIARTLPLIENYQTDKLPATGPLEGHSKKVESTLLQLEKNTKGF